VAIVALLAFGLGWMAAFTLIQFWMGRPPK
jgi:hypothetical protein